MKSRLACRQFRLDRLIFQRADCFTLFGVYGVVLLLFCWALIFGRVEACFLEANCRFAGALPDDAGGHRGGAVCVAGGGRPQQPEPVPGAALRRVLEPPQLHHRPVAAFAVPPRVPGTLCCLRELKLGAKYPDNFRRLLDSSLSRQLGQFDGISVIRKTLTK